jgi:GNAT superfamily N-acetyltransferase
LPRSCDADWLIERLTKAHERTSFVRGQPALDDWLKLRAGQFDRKGLARTFVAVRPAPTQVLGYYALSSHRVRFDALPEDQAKGLPKIDVPVILLGRLAVERTMQGQGLGSFLLIDALLRALQVANELGVRALKSMPSTTMPAAFT